MQLSDNLRALNLPDSVEPTPRSWGLPDLSVAEAEGQRLRNSLVAAHIELMLPPGAPAVHPSFGLNVQEHLVGRAATVWQDADRFNVSFGAFGHVERDVVDELAYGLAQRLGATVVFATTVGMVVSANADFLT